MKGGTLMNSKAIAAIAVIAIAGIAAVMIKKVRT